MSNETIRKTVARSVDIMDGIDCVMYDMRTADRHGDMIDDGPDVFETRDFGNNPICLVNHNYDFVAGTWPNVRVEGRQLKGRLKLAPPSSPRLRELHSLIKNKIIRGISIGFMPIVSEPRRNGGTLFKKVSLVEASIVAIPSSPGALMQCKTLGISEATQRAVFKEFTLGERIRAAKAATPSKDLSRIASDLRFAEGQKKFEAVAAKGLANLQPLILKAYQHHTDAVLAQDLAGQLRAMREIEKLERMERFYQDHLPKPPPPPPKPKSRFDLIVEAQEKQRKATEDHFTRLNAQAEADWNRAQSDTFRQSIEAYWDEEAERRDKKK